MGNFYYSLTVSFFILQINLLVNGFHLLDKIYSTLGYTILKGKFQLSEDNDEININFINFIAYQNIEYPIFERSLSKFLNGKTLCLE